MSDFIFATFLYAAMICFVCCLRYQPSSAATIPTDTANLADGEPQPADTNQVSTTFPEQKPEAANALIEESLAASDDPYKTAQSEEPVVETLKAVESESVKAVGTLNPSKLTVRQCRAVIREINKGLPKQDRIRQKINGKDAPADWLRSQIARHLETHPATAITLEQVS
ncbi:MAG TPA: hypothetical protein V6C95_12645 [Coleofasciculaceae cyanobacterium]